MRRIFVGLTGASGARYGLKLLEELNRHEDIELHTALTADALTNISLETGRELSAPEDVLSAFSLGRTRLHDVRDFAAPVASGSFQLECAVIAPASMGCVGRVAGAMSTNLIERCADVALKEGKKLIMLFREAPLSALHLENLLRLSRAGAHIVPAAPGFYHNPQTIDDMIGFMAGKLLDLMNVEHDLFTRWKS